MLLKSKKEQVEDGKRILHLMTSIGFKLVNHNYTSTGGVFTYKYFPSYLQDKHYKLIVFKFHKSIYNHHQLFIMDNFEETYGGSMYDTNTSHYDELMGNIKVIFAAEMRVITIQEIMKFND